MPRDLRIAVVYAAARFCETGDDIARRALQQAVLAYQWWEKDRVRRRRRENYRRARRRLIADMGGECSICKRKKNWSSIIRRVRTGTRQRRVAG